MDKTKSPERESKKTEKIKKSYQDEIEFGNDITVTINNPFVIVKGPKGQTQKQLYDKKVSISVSNNSIILKSSDSSKRGKKTLNSFAAHIKNLLHGVKEPYMYRLKICSGHFPMTVTVEKQKIVIKNFLGEKVPRVAEFPADVSVVVDGDHINVESVNKEIASQAAASIEQLTRRPGFDTRVFQDGCYIIEKAGKVLK